MSIREELEKEENAVTVEFECDNGHTDEYEVVQLVTFNDREYAALEDEDEFNAVVAFLEAQEEEESAAEPTVGHTIVVSDN